MIISNRLNASYQTTGDPGLVQKVTHTDHSYTIYSYDGQGRILTECGSADYALRHDYDTLGRRWKLHTYRDATPDFTQAGDVTTWEYISGTSGR